MSNDKIVRARLSAWRKKELLKANYTCLRCGEVGGKLEVHHTQPLRDIYTKFSPLKKIAEYQCESQDFQSLVDVIEQYHMTHSIAYVCCEKCHAEIDTFRKI